MKRDHRRRPDLAWRCCCILALGLAVASFSPLVLTAGRVGPRVLGLPFTLWAGISVSFAFVLLTFIGTRVHPDRESTGDDASRGERP